jgi:hypothetical protein
VKFSNTIQLSPKQFHKVHFECIRYILYSTILTTTVNKRVRQTSNNNVCHYDVDIFSPVLKFIMPGGHVLFFYFFYLFRDFWCPTRFPYRMMFVSFNSNTTGTTSGQELLTLPEHMSSPPVLSRVLVAQSLVFCVVFCVKSFVSLSCFWSLCCLSFSHLRILITLLVSSNFS